MVFKIHLTMNPNPVTAAAWDKYRNDPERLGKFLGMNPNLWEHSQNEEVTGEPVWTYQNILSKLDQVRYSTRQTALAPLGTCIINLIIV